MSISLSEIELVSANPARFTDLYQWRVRLDVLEHLEHPVECKVVWIGSSSSSAFDEQLEECEVGPLAVGANEFILEHEAPDWRRLPPEDLLSVTVILLILSYQGQEFLRIGYYVNVAYDKETLNQEPPEHIEIRRLARNVLVSKPTLVTKVINWGTPAADWSMDGFPVADQQHKPGSDDHAPMDADNSLPEAPKTPETECLRSRADAMQESTPLNPTQPLSATPPSMHCM